MIFKIHIPRRHNKCLNCSKKIEGGNEYHSVLFEQGEEEFAREDFCPECWVKVNETEKMKQACTHWKSTVPIKPSEDESSKNRIEKALELLKAGIEGEDHEKNLILAMFLQRKKIIILRQELTREDGSQYLLYEVNGTEEMIPVPKVSITNINVAQIQNEILKSFNR